LDDTEVIPSFFSLPSLIQLVRKINANYVFYFNKTRARISKTYISLISKIIYTKSNKTTVLCNAC